MATFVLVRGGSEDRDDWAAAGGLLEARGHRVARPRMAAARESTLAAHAESVRGTLDTCDEPALLVEPSYGGLMSTVPSG